MPKYDDNKVTNAEVASLKRRVSSAPREAKLGRWYAARHSSSLQRDQNSGYHWQYLKGEGNLHCTCGLVIYGDELLPLHYPNADLNLHPLPLIAGHRNLPSCEGETVALIVRYTPIDKVGNWVWTAFCQVCGDHVKDVPLADAKEFVSGHNQSCVWPEIPKGKIQ